MVRVQEFFDDRKYIVRLYIDLSSCHNDGLSLCIVDGLFFIGSPVVKVCATRNRLPHCRKNDKRHDLITGPRLVKVPFCQYRSGPIPLGSLFPSNGSLSVPRLV